MREATLVGLTDQKAMTRAARQNQRCPECKERVREILERIYGKCLANHRFSWAARLSSYDGTSIYPTLQSVARALEDYRGFGFEEFVRAKTVATCDYWIPNPGFVVEFDESQHFANPRKLALSMYPVEHPLGFSRKRWITLCERLDKKDNDPSYRDEQRAWYDALRDLVPRSEGFLPTVRVYAHDFAWCSLDPENGGHRRRFSAIISSMERVL